MDDISAQAYAQHKLPEAKVTRTDDEWREMLGDSYSVLRQEDTEYAFSGKYDKHKENGSYECKGCGAELFVSKDKFDSGTGWPSFVDAANKKAVIYVKEHQTNNWYYEIKCATCLSHLGHVFNDGPKDKTGLRYCINSVCLNFKK